MFEKIENDFSFSSSQNPEMLPAKRDEPGHGKMEDQIPAGEFLLKNAERIGSVDNYLKCSMIEPNSMYPRKLAAFLS